MQTGAQPGRAGAGRRGAPRGEQHVGAGRVVCREEGEPRGRRAGRAPRPVVSGRPVSKMPARAAAGSGARGPLPSRTEWTRLVPPPVLTGHVSSLGGRDETGWAARGAGGAHMTKSQSGRRARAASSAHGGREMRVAWRVSRGRGMGAKDATCPFNTEGRTRSVRSVRGEGQGVSGPYEGRAEGGLPSRASTR